MRPYSLFAALPMAIATLLCTFLLVALPFQAAAEECETRSYWAPSSTRDACIAKYHSTKEGCESCHGETCVEMVLKVDACCGRDGVCATAWCSLDCSKGQD